MDYVMYIQCGGNLGHAEFEEYEKAYEAMKVMVARQIGVGTDMLDGMMDASGDGPFFYIHRDQAYVDAQEGMDGLVIRIEEVEEPILAYAALNIEKTCICLKLMDQFYSVLESCKAKLEDLEMEPVVVLTLIGSLKGVYDSLKAIDIELDEETENEYQKLYGILKYHLGYDE